jgi:hypothetical protein
MYKSLIDGNEVKVYEIGKSDSFYPDEDTDLLLKDIIHKYNSSSDKIEFYLKFKKGNETIVRKFPEFDPVEPAEPVFITNIKKTPKTPSLKYTSEAMNFFKCFRHWNNPNHNDYYGGCDDLKINSAIFISYLRNDAVCGDNYPKFFSDMGFSKISRTVQYLDRVGFKFKDEEIKDCKEWLKDLKNYYSKCIGRAYCDDDLAKDYLNTCSIAFDFCKKITTHEPNIIQRNISEIRAKFFPKKLETDLLKP